MKRMSIKISVIITIILTLSIIIGLFVKGNLTPYSNIIENPTEAVKENKLSMVQQYMSIPVKSTTRALCTDGNYLYHSGSSSFAITKVDISNENSPNIITTVGGHRIGKYAAYPRNMTKDSDYLYVPYRDTTAGSSTVASEDIGGFLDVIDVNKFTNDDINTIKYPRLAINTSDLINNYNIQPLNEDYSQDDDVKLSFGKSGHTATYTFKSKKYLCVTQMMGGWLLYDISTNPTLEDAEPIYTYDNRLQSYTDNHTYKDLETNKIYDNLGKGYAEFQEPVFFETNGTLYLAIAGYDRDLCTIYDLSDPEKPLEVFGYKTDIKENTNTYKSSIRALLKDKVKDWETSSILHTMGIAYKAPYLYCTIAAYPGKTSADQAFVGVAVIDVSDIKNITCKVFEMPTEDMPDVVPGESSPASIAINDRHLIMDNAEKGISVWSLEQPGSPEYLGCLETNTTVCSIYMFDDGTACAGVYLSADDIKNKDGKPIIIFKGL